MKKSIKKQVAEFCKSRGLTPDQFTGKEKFEGDLYLSSLTSIPEGFNPTVGGYLDLSSLTSIPEGFNPTVGGSLYWKNNSKRIGASVPPVIIPKPNRNFIWEKYSKKFALIDSIFCEVLNERETIINEEKYKAYTAKKIGKTETFVIVNKGEYYAHSKDIKKAFEDLQFKIAAEKLKKEPIQKDTMLTVKHYRLLTGACDFGCRDWMKANNIPFDVIDGEAVEKNPIRADQLLPLLKKSNAYGHERIKALVTF